MAAYSFALTDSTGAQSMGKIYSPPVGRLDVLALGPSHFVTVPFSLFVSAAMSFAQDFPPESPVFDLGMSSTGALAMPSMGRRTGWQIFPRGNR